MRRLTLYTISLLVVIGGNTMAQTAAEKKSAVEKKAIDERKRSLGGHRGAQEFNKNTAGQATDSTNREAEPLPPSGRREDGVVTINTDQPKNTANNAPAVIQVTTSEAGSPAILSENQGRERDGTGNVQRSSYNIAGAKIQGDMQLYKNSNTQRNMNTGAPRVRKQEEQPARITSGKGKTGKQEALPQERADNGKDNVTKKSSAKSKGKVKSRKGRKAKDKDSRR